MVSSPSPKARDARGSACATSDGCFGPSDRVVAYGLLGRTSNRAPNPTLRERALAKAREPLYDDFGPTLLADIWRRTPAIGFVHPHTLRLWMIEYGLWKVKPRKARRRKRRERRAVFGELVLIDTSIHPWLEERSSEEIVLIALLDDATSRLHARFFPRDPCGLSTAAHG
jgi:hypothetical protein